MNNNKYPQGKLNERDEGETELRIVEENGKVVIKFKRPVAWIGLDPDQTVEFAQVLITHAMNIGLKKPFSLKL